MARLYNLARMHTATLGPVTTIELGAAVTGFLSFANAGVTDGITISYAINDPRGGGSEVGSGVYHAGTPPTFTRTTVEKSSDGTSRISLSAYAEIMIAPAASHLNKIPFSSTDNAITRYDGVEGALQNSGITVDDDNIVAGAKVLPTGAGTARPLATRFSDVFNVKDYGAVGDGATNDTTAVAAALTAIGTSNAVLYFPAGTYLLTTNTLTKTLSGNQSVKIRGDGTDTTILYFNGTGNGLGFTFTTLSFSWVAGNNMIFEDLAFVCNVANPTGSAIVIDGNCTIGNPNRPTILSRVGFRGTSVSNSCWGVGAFITDLQNVEANDCYFFGSVLGVVGTGIVYTGTSNAEHPAVLSVHNWQQQFGEVGIHCTGYVEGLNVVQSNFTQTNYGVLVGTTGSLPMFSVTGSQLNCNLVCIQLTDCAASQITGNMIFTNAANAVGIVANNPYHTITGNTMVSNAATCTAIILQSGATDCVIGSNVFKNFTTNIWLQSGANNNVIGRNRYADGTPVFDSGTGNIWFTETNSSFSPRAADGQSLGTASLPWSDGFFASGAVVDFNSDVTLTHSSGALALNKLWDLSGASAGQVKFPATQNASADANTLDDYEEGTWTPIDSSGASLSLTGAAGTYVKIGSMVTASGTFTYPVTANGSNAKIGGLPFANASGEANRQGLLSYTTAATANKALQDAAATTFLIATAAGASVTNANMSTTLNYAQFTYKT